MGEIAFVDCEASSLRSGSFITELGWAIVDSERHIRSDSCLIRPLAKWLRVESAWDPASERLTGISKELLEREGTQLADAVRRFLDDIRDADWYSDEPAFDQYWLEQLFEAAGVDLGGRKLRDATKLLAEASATHPDPNAALARAEECVSAKITTRHRAEPDARRMADVYCWLVAL